MTTTRRIKIAPVVEMLATGPLDAQVIAKALARTAEFRSVEAFPKEKSSKWTPRSWSTGIYVLDTGDGLAYVGQTTDLVGRLNQHRKTYPALRAVSFARFPERRLDDVESTVARGLQRVGVRLWNKTLIDLLCVPTPLDESFPSQLHAQWLSDLSWNDWGGPRQDDVDQRHRYRANFDEFAACEEYGEIIDGFRRFVSATIPAPLRTEFTYWSTTCHQPDAQGPFVRLNVGLQASLDATRSPTGGGTRFALWIPEAIAEQALNAELRTTGRQAGRAVLRAVEVKATFDFTSLKAAGRDQIVLNIDGADQFRELLLHAPFIREVRRMHLGLMQRSKNLNKRSHCLQVADELLVPPEIQHAAGRRQLLPAPIVVSVPPTPKVPINKGSGERKRLRAYTLLEQQVLKHLPSGAPRDAVVRRLRDSIELATVKAPVKWGLSVLREGLRLNVGMIEVMTVTPEWIRLLVVHSRVPRECDEDEELFVLRSPQPNEGVYPSVSQSAVVAIPTDHPNLDELLSRILAPAHQALIERASTTRPNPSMARGHRAEAVDLVRELCSGE